ncbi:MAG TPA: mannosyltransferase family protein [Chloroflexia bacterium]|nr:mannosyltransferase family protein [Chloroflexia bacterium]
MPKEASRDEDATRKARPDTDTRQIPVVLAAPHNDEVDPQITSPSSDPHKTIAQPAVMNAPLAGTDAVPEETVPMQVSEWAKVTQAVAPEAPSKPPPLRSKDPHAGTSGKQTELSSRPGLFTGELRRALPQWTLPLVTFQPVSVWLGARIGLTLLAFLAGLMLPGLPPKGTANWYGSPGGPSLTGFVDRIGGVWTRWDGQWYLKIATEGYKRDDGSAAFFPLYPWVVQVVGWLAAERYIWASILLSSVFLLGAMVLLHRLVRLDFHPEDAGRTVFYLAAFPMAFFFWAVYSESLFLLLAVAALLSMRTGRWWWSAVAISFAIWTRAAGVLLILPLAWELYRAFRPPMPKEPNAMPLARPQRLNLLAPVLPLLSLLVLLGWAAAEFGDPFASINAQTGWNRHFSWPWETVAGAFREANAMPFQFQPENQSWTYLASLIFALVIGVLALRWLRGSYNLFLWPGILFPLFSATPHNPLLSYPRFLIVLFPVFIVLALVGRNRYAHQIITWVSLLLLALFTIRFANWYWVA